MSTTVVVVPCLPVARPHLREAYRALIGQGHHRDALSDDNLAQLLWLARALPVAVDVVDGLALVDTCFPSATVEVLRRPPDRGPLALLGWRRDDDAFVELLVLSPAALHAGAFADAFVRIVVDVATIEHAPAGGDEDEPTVEVVRLQRFTIA
jgi:hypothetical protein